MMVLVLWNAGVWQDGALATSAWLQGNYEGVDGFIGRALGS